MIIQILELDSGIDSGKLPIYTFLLGVSVAMPLFKLDVEIFKIVDSVISNTLLGQKG